VSSLRHLSVSIVIAVFSLVASGNDPWRMADGAAEAGMGGIGIMRTSFWSSFRNQAALAYQGSLSAGINYGNRFGLKELGTRSAAIIYPAGNATLGAVYSNFGYTDFRRHSASLACGLKLSEKLAGGAQVDYFSEKTFGEYSDHSAVTFELGLLFSPAENVRAGVHVFNPVPQSLRKSFLPSRVTAGAGIDLGKGVFAGFEAEMSTSYKLVIRTGFEYEAVKSLILRGGFSSGNNSFTFGVGYLMDFLKIDLGFATHDKLGVTSSASLIFIMKSIN
jgi:hypothetical protein